MTFKKTHDKFFSIVDRLWLTEVIEAKEAHANDVNGALISEIISDLFVLGSGTLTVAFAVATGSLVPLAVNPLPFVQLGLAYLTIKSLYDQKIKTDNDLHVLNAILNVDEQTPENVTGMLRDYISIHSDTDVTGQGSKIEIKTLSPEALRVVQKNFRKKQPRQSLVQKTAIMGGFLKSHFSNAAKMVAKTVVHPIDLVKCVAKAVKNTRHLSQNWGHVSRNVHANTLRETYKYTLARAREDAEQKDLLPSDSGALFSDERRNQLYYLHQKQASLRTVSKLRIETAYGFGACAGIIALATYGILAAASPIAMVGNVYTIIASLPSLKMLGDEMDSLTKTATKHEPSVNRAAAEFLVGLPKPQTAYL